MKNKRGNFLRVFAAAIGLVLFGFQASAQTTCLTGATVTGVGTLFLDDNLQLSANINNKYPQLVVAVRDKNNFAVTYTTSGSVDLSNNQHGETLMQMALIAWQTGNPVTLTTNLNNCATNNSHTGSNYPIWWVRGLSGILLEQ